MTVERFSDAARGAAEGEKMSKILWHQCPVCSVKHNRESVLCLRHSVIAWVWDMLDAAVTFAGAVLLVAAIWVLTR